MKSYRSIKNNVVDKSKLIPTTTTVNHSINIISFPRSGQHLLQSILNYIFINNNLEYSFCEYYSCCNSVPCKFKRIICKNHDINLDYKILPSEKYVVLYRNDMILQLEAYYRHRIKENKLEYKYHDLIKFIKEKSKYYSNFKDKWIDKNYDNVLKIEYYDLVTNTVDCIKKIMAHIRPDIMLNSEIIDKIPELKFGEYGKSHVSKNSIGILNKMSDDLYQKIKVELVKSGIQMRID